MVISAHLEKLIFEGKAEFKTFSTGASQKTIMQVDPNSYIVITNLQWNPPNMGGSTNDLSNWDLNRVVQCSIFSKSRFNNFLWRSEVGNSFELPGVTTYPTNGTVFNTPTYLIHDSDVSINFIQGHPLIAGSFLPSNVEEITKPIPLGFGGEADPTRINVVKKANIPLIPGYSFYPAGKSEPISSANGSLDYVFPTDVASAIGNVKHMTIAGQLLLNISYVKIYGRLPKQIK